MLKNPQAQAQSFVDLTEPQEETDAPGEVVEIIDKPSRSTSVKRSRSQDQSEQGHAKAKRARSATITSTITSQRSLSPRRDYPRGTSTITKPKESSTITTTSTVTSAQQDHSEVTGHPSSRSDILIAPWWPSQPWFPHLLQLCVDHPLFLPYCRDLLSQQSQEFILDGKSYHLHAWRLSCDTTKQRDFRTRSLGLPQHLEDSRHIACTMTGGFVSLTEQHGKDLICLTPQMLK